MSAEREVQPTLRAKVKQAFQKVKTKVKEKLHIKNVSENERTPLGKRIKFWMTLAKEKFKARFGIKDRDVEAEEAGTPDRETGGPDREGGGDPERESASPERESPDRESGTPERDCPAPEEMPTPEEGHRDPFPVPEGRGDTPPDRESGTPEAAGPKAAAPDRDGGTPERMREGPDRTAEGSSRAADGAAETGARDGPDVPEGRESPARGSPSPQDSPSSRPSSSTSRKPGSSTMTNRNRQERVSIIARLEGFKAIVDAQVHEQELESGIETGKESAPEAGAARESGTTGKEPVQAAGKDAGREGTAGAERVLDKGKSRETGKAGPRRGGKRLAKKKGKGPKIGKRLKKAVR